MRPSLAGTNTAHVADSQRSLLTTRCSQYNARADSQKRRSPVPIQIVSRTSTEVCGRDVGLLVASFSYRNESFAMRVRVDHKHSRAIVQEIGERLRAFLKEEPELPGSLKTQIDRLRELEEQPPSIIPAAERWDKLRR